MSLCSVLGGMALANAKLGSVRASIFNKPYPSLSMCVSDPSTRIAHFSPDFAFCVLGSWVRWCFGWCAAPGSSRGCLRGPYYSRFPSIRGPNVKRGPDLGMKQSIQQLTALYILHIGLVTVLHCGQYSRSPTARPQESRSGSIHSGSVFSEMELLLSLMSVFYVLFP